MQSQQIYYAVDPGVNIFYFCAPRRKGRVSKMLALVEEFLGLQSNPKNSFLRQEAIKTTNVYIIRPFRDYRKTLRFFVVLPQGRTFLLGWKSFKFSQKYLPLRSVLTYQVFFMMSPGRSLTYQRLLDLLSDQSEAFEGVFRAMEAI